MNHCFMFLAIVTNNFWRWSRVSFSTYENRKASIDKNIESLCNWIFVLNFFQLHSAGISQTMCFSVHYLTLLNYFVASSLKSGSGLKKYLNSSLPFRQLTLKYCSPMAIPHLPKFSNSLMTHEPKMACLCWLVLLSLDQVIQVRALPGDIGK